MLTNLASGWTKVVTQPLGLAGFVLFLVFGLLAKLKRGDERRWLFPAAVVMAGIALLGGLSLSYVQLQRSNAAVNAAPVPVQLPLNQTNDAVHQSSSGAGSPNVQGVQGGVTITIDQSSGQTKAQKVKAGPQPKKPQ